MRSPVFPWGRDDYITKPFGLMATAGQGGPDAASAQAVSRRGKKDDYADSRYHFQFEEMRFYVDGQEIVLSKIEQKLFGFSCGTGADPYKGSG